MGNISLDNIPKEEQNNFYRIKELIDICTNYQKLQVQKKFKEIGSFKQHKEIDYEKMNKYVTEIKRFVNIESSTQ